MPVEQYTYWSITINNPDENDMLIVRNPNDKYIRGFVWTLEEGEEGTPHIQAWVRLQRNQSHSFVKKLYPRAHIKPCRKDEYNENTHQYAQKNDETTASNHIITLNDPLPDSAGIVVQVIKRWNMPLTAQSLYLGNDADGWFKDRKVAYEFLREKLIQIENEMVEEKPYLAKMFVSPVYERMLKRFWRQIIFNVYMYKPDADDSSTVSSEVQEVVVPTCDAESQDNEDYEDGSSTEDEGYDESRSSCGSEEDAGEEY